MVTYTLGQLTAAQLQEFADVDNRGVVPGVWDDRDLGELTEEEQSFLSTLHKHLVSYQTLLLNEATIWSRAIYPLLLLAERGNIHAYAGVPLSATFSQGELRGEVDGALAGMGIVAEPAPPYRGSQTGRGGS